MKLWPKCDYMNAYFVKDSHIISEYLIKNFLSTKKTITSLSYNKDRLALLCRLVIN